MKNTFSRSLIHIFGREIMAVTRFSRVAGGAGVYGGELANQQVVDLKKALKTKYLCGL